MTNNNIITNFINGQIAKTGNLISQGNKLINYNTCIAYIDNDKYIVSNTKYSNTTSKIQNELIRQLEKNCKKFELKSLPW